MHILLISTVPLGYTGYTRNYCACARVLQGLGISCVCLVPPSSAEMVAESLKDAGSVEYLSPQLFARSKGARPDGILLFGNGKTPMALLACATAYTAGVPVLRVGDGALFLEVAPYSYQPDVALAYRCGLGFDPSLAGGLMLGQVGDFLNRKSGQSFTFEVLRRLRARQDDSALLLVGDGPMRMELTAQAAYEYLPVSMPGKTQSLHAMLMVMDVLLCPAERVDPYLLAEAALAGLPCIVSSRARGVGERDGILRLEPDPQRWAEAALTLHAANQNREAISAVRATGAEPVFSAFLRDIGK
ncbi:MAG: hypothetical protein DELT_01394 [Desulfovibrio sp.]